MAHRDCFQGKTYLVRSSIFLVGMLAFCLPLLSSCGSGGNDHSEGTSLSSPAITTTLKNKGETQLQTFQQWIILAQHYHVDVTAFQQQYHDDQHALQQAQTENAYTTALQRLATHTQSIQLPTMKSEADSLHQTLQQQVKSWGTQHTYYDAYDMTSYPLGYSYGEKGVEGWLQDAFASAKTVADYQPIIEDLHMYLTNFQAMTKDSNDLTPYNQPHQSDLDLLHHYDKMNRRTLVVSLSEQAMRVYDKGKLVQSFLVTTGTPAHPSLAGAWWVEGKQSPTVFHSPAPKGSPDWYPDTPINYAIQYHSNGYFLHDSWWRSDYGPGTNFPHQDPGGDSAAQQGSHGCVNMSKEDAAWVYQFVQLYTSILIY